MTARAPFDPTGKSPKELINQIRSLEETASLQDQALQRAQRSSLAEFIAGAKEMRTKTIKTLQAQALRVKREGGPGSGRVVALIEGIIQEFLTLSPEKGVEGEGATKVSRLDL